MACHQSGSHARQFVPEILVADEGDFGGGDLETHEAMIGVEEKVHFEVRSGDAERSVGFPVGAGGAGGLGGNMPTRRAISVHNQLVQATSTKIDDYATNQALADKRSTGVDKSLV